MTGNGLLAYATDPVAFIDDLVHKNELGKPFRLLDHHRALLRLAFDFDADGRLWWDLLLWAAIKKDAKSFIAALILLFWGFVQEAPNEIDIRSNDLQQSQSRVGRMIVGLLKHNPVLGRCAKVLTDRIQLSNGTLYRMLPQDWQGESGGNQGCISEDELWARIGESARRAWDEAPPVPTRKNSVRIVTTYAGIDGESALLKELYLAGVGKEEHPDGQGERIHPALPVYANREARIFCYWDHEPRCPWQTEEYLAARKKELAGRPNTYARQYENRWTAAESAFISAEAWDQCVAPDWSPLAPTRDHPLWVGVDASTKRDTTAVVAVLRDLEDGLVVLARHHIWRPSPEHPLDLAAVEAFLIDLARTYRVQRIVCDPYQLHGTIQRLRAYPYCLPMEEFPQTPERLTQASQGLYDLVRDRRLVVYADEELRKQALSATALESERGFRIAKDRSSKKIDALVALAMAASVAVSERVVPALVIT